MLDVTDFVFHYIYFWFLQWCRYKNFQLFTTKNFLSRSKWILTISSLWWASHEGYGFGYWFLHCSLSLTRSSACSNCSLIVFNFCFSFILNYNCSRFMSFLLNIWQSTYIKPIIFSFSFHFDFQKYTSEPNLLFLETKYCFWCTLLHYVLDCQLKLSEFEVCGVPKNYNFDLF